MLCAHCGALEPGRLHAPLRLLEWQVLHCCAILGTLIDQG